MKKEKANVCPGCHRHCAANAVRCKYGRAYFGKQGKAEEKKAAAPLCGGKCKHKWEAYTASGGPMWELLTTARKIKKHLCRQAITEDELLRALSPQEREALSAAVQKLRAAVAGE